ARHPSRDLAVHRVARPAGAHPPRFEFGSGRVGRERTISWEECPATSAGHSPCLREVNVTDGRRSPLPSPDTVVCQERVARHLAFCPTPAPVTIRSGVLLVRTVVTGSTVEVSPERANDGLSLGSCVQAPQQSQPPPR